MSDLLIKNMEMPKERKMFVIEPDGSVWIQIADTSYFCTGSKAVALPEHGRLIDADNIEDKKSYNYDEDFEVIDWCEIENAPTVVEASK